MQVEIFFLSILFSLVKKTDWMRTINLKLHEKKKNSIMCSFIFENCLKHSDLPIENVAWNDFLMVCIEKIISKIKDSFDVNCSYFYLSVKNRGWR